MKPSNSDQTQKTRPKNQRPSGWTAISWCQLGFLIVVSISFFVAAPQHWRFTPDSGIYIGTAVNLVDTGRYWFNGHPNLLYYPGTSSVIAIVYFLIGLDFHVLHYVFSAILIVFIWVARYYFSPERYGWIGVFLPFLATSAGIVQLQAFRILSDGLFATLVMISLMFWRYHEENDDQKALFGAMAISALSALVRFHGIILIMALACALLIHLWRKGSSILRCTIIASASCLGALLPFALWTARNLQVHTPDTYNMANRFFFGLKGPALYAPTGPVDTQWLGSQLEKSFASLFLGLYQLSETLLGPIFTDIGTPVAATFLLVFLCVIGARRWWDKSSTAEFFFVVFMLGFILQTLLKGGLYFPDRYWLPVLLFLVTMAAFGVCPPGRELDPMPIRTLRRGAGLMLAAAIIVHGVTNFLVLTSDKKRQFWAGSNDTLKELSLFIEATVPEDSALAATDWGVIPFVSNRRTIQVTNDTDGKISLGRIHRNKCEYLVILEEVSLFSKSAKELVDNRHDLFRLVKEIKPQMSNGTAAAIYSVNLDPLRN